MGIIDKLGEFFGKNKVETTKSISNKLHLKKGVIPGKYKEYWFIAGDGEGGTAGVRVYTEDPGEIDYFYCVATDLEKAYRLYNKHIEE